MKIIGEYVNVLEEGYTDDYGRNNVPYKSIITEVDGTENRTKLYNIELYEIYPGGDTGENLLKGIWAKTIQGAKRAINLDRGWKSKDWVWKIIED